MRFQSFDFDRPIRTFREGDTIQVATDRTVLDELTELEPLDERSDSFVSVPVRSVVTAGAGPSVEFGPFSLDSKDVVRLHNALIDHMTAFPSEYKFRTNKGENE
jgi:hypothetical protein